MSLLTPPPSISPRFSQSPQPPNTISSLSQFLKNGHLKYLLAGNIYIPDDVNIHIKRQIKSNVVPDVNNMMIHESKVPSKENNAPNSDLTVISTHLFDKHIVIDEDNQFSQKVKKIWDMSCWIFTSISSLGQLQSMFSKVTYEIHGTFPKTKLIYKQIGSAILVIGFVVIYDNFLPSSTHVISKNSTVVDIASESILNVRLPFGYPLSFNDARNAITLTGNVVATTIETASPFFMHFLDFSAVLDRQESKGLLEKFIRELTNDELISFLELWQSIVPLSDFNMADCPKDFLKIFKNANETRYISGDRNQKLHIKKDLKNQLWARLSHSKFRKNDDCFVSVHNLNTTQLSEIFIQMNKTDIADQLQNEQAKFVNHSVTANYHARKDDYQQYVKENVEFFKYLYMEKFSYLDFFIGGYVSSFKTRIDPLIYAGYTMDNIKDAHYASKNMNNINSWVEKWAPSKDQITILTTAVQAALMGPGPTAIVPLVADNLGVQAAKNSIITWFLTKSIHIIGQELTADIMSKMYNAMKDENYALIENELNITTHYPKWAELDEEFQKKMLRAIVKFFNAIAADPTIQLEHFLKYIFAETLNTPRSVDSTSWIGITNFCSQEFEPGTNFLTSMSSGAFSIFSAYATFNIVKNIKKLCNGVIDFPNPRRIIYYKEEEVQSSAYVLMLLYGTLSHFPLFPLQLLKTPDVGSMGFKIGQLLKTIDNDFENFDITAVKNNLLLNCNLNGDIHLKELDTLTEVIESLKGTSLFNNDDSATYSLLQKNKNPKLSTTNERCYVHVHKLPSDGNLIPFYTTTYKKKFRLSGIYCMDASSNHQNVIFKHHANEYYEWWKTEMITDNEVTKEKMLKQKSVMPEGIMPDMKETILEELSIVNLNARYAIYVDDNPWQKKEDALNDAVDIVFNLCKSDKSEEGDKQIIKYNEIDKHIIKHEHCVVSTYVIAKMSCQEIADPIKNMVDAIGRLNKKIFDDVDIKNELMCNNHVALDMEIYDYASDPLFLLRTIDPIKIIRKIATLEQRDIKLYCYNSLSQTEQYTPTVMINYEPRQNDDIARQRTAPVLIGYIPTEYPYWAMPHFISIIKCQSTLKMAAVLSKYKEKEEKDTLETIFTNSRPLNVSWISKIMKFFKKPLDEDKWESDSESGDEDKWESDSESGDEDIAETRKKISPKKQLFRPSVIKPHDGKGYVVKVRSVYYRVPGRNGKSKKDN